MGTDVSQLSTNTHREGGEFKVLETTDTKYTSTSLPTVTDTNTDTDTKHPTSRPLVDGDGHVTPPDLVTGDDGGLDCPSSDS